MTFQRYTKQFFGNIDGVFIYFDDLPIFARSLEEHDKILKEVLHIALANNVKFNKDKLQFRLPKVKYTGFTLPKDGLSVNETRVEFILMLKNPDSKVGLQKI